MNPLISIIIPLYNRQDLILETLESVYHQTYKNLECVIVDDGSSDSSYEIVENYIKDKDNFRLYRRPDGYLPGGCGARNYGFIRSKGDYINWLDSDDLLEPEKLANQVNLILISQADLAICDWQKFRGDKLLDSKSSIAKKNPKKGVEVIKLMGELKTICITHVYLIKREIIIKSGLWNEYLKINQDGEFYCRILINSSKVVSDPTIQCLYRAHDGERVSASVDTFKFKQRIESWKLIESYLKIIDKNEFKVYINVKKSIIFSQLIKNSQKKLVANDKDFFSEQIEEYNSFSNRKNRFKSWIYNLLYN